MKKLFYALLVTFLMPVAVFAATINTGEDVLVKDAVQDSLYVAGDNVQIESKIDGDTYVAAGEANILGDIAGDLTIVGGKLNLKGAVDGDVRMSGGEIQILGKIKEDLVIMGGGKVIILEYAEIGGDVFVNGGSVLIQGKVDGDVLVNSGHITVDGAIGGNAKLTGGKVAINGSIAGFSEISARYKITLGDKASFGNDIKYWSPQGVMSFGENKAEFVSDMGNKAVFFDIKAEKFIMALCFISGVVMILFLMFASNFFAGAAQNLRSNPWKSLGYGVLYFLLTPVIAALFMMSVIGIPIGLFLMFMYVFSFVFAKAISALVIASYGVECCAKRKKKCGKLHLFLMAVLAYALIKLICWIPFVGMLAVVIIVLFAFGAFLTKKFEVLKKII